MTDAPEWLKAMENGGLGEARAKAFLMDRFWVLERSVDIEGADYLIQRKLTSRNFMDRDPPRLGVVQVKFIQDGGTGISLHKKYVCDTTGHPYGEFFLLVFTGREDEEKSYLLSAADVLKEFKEVTDDDRTVLRIGGSKLMATANYEVLQRGRALDKIEHALANADFFANRRFLLGVGSPYIKISPEHIDHDLVAPLDNPYATLRELFFEEKRKVQRVMWDMEEVTETMHKMLATTSPDEAFRLYKDEIADHVDGYCNITFSGDFFRDSDFEEAVRRHRFRLTRLRELGIEGTYFKLLAEYRETVAKGLGGLRLDDVSTVKVTATYDAESLRNPRVTLAVEETPQKTSHVECSKRGEQKLFFELKRLKREMVERTDDKTPDEVIKGLLWTFTRPFEETLEAIYIDGGQ